MEQIRQYILSIISVAIICSIAKKITGSKFQSIINVICSIFLIVTVLSPIIKFEYRFTDFSFDDYSLEAQAIVKESEEYVDESICAIIRDQTQTYILNKANALGLDIKVNVVLDENESVPVMVNIYGDGSPYQRSILTRYIESTLGVPEANQIWI